MILQNQIHYASRFTHRLQDIPSNLPLAIDNTCILKRSSKSNIVLPNNIMILNCRCLLAIAVTC